MLLRKTLMWDRDNLVDRKLTAFLKTTCFSKPTQSCGNYEIDRNWTEISVIARMQTTSDRNLSRIVVDKFRGSRIVKTLECFSSSYRLPPTKPMQYFFLFVFLCSFCSQASHLLCLHLDLVRVFKVLIMFCRNMSNYRKPSLLNLIPGVFVFVFYTHSHLNHVCLLNSFGFGYVQYAVSLGHCMCVGDSHEKLTKILLLLELISISYSAPVFSSLSVSCWSSLLSQTMQPNITWLLLNTNWDNLLLKPKPMPLFILLIFTLFYYI